MRHRKGNLKLSRASDQRRALLRSLVASLLERGKIKVTLTRAKEARKLAEKVIALTKHNDLSSRRRVAAFLGRGDLVAPIFSKFPERYEGRPGGFTRIIRAGVRRGDAAPMAILELV